MVSLHPLLFPVFCSFLYSSQNTILECKLEHVLPFQHPFKLSTAFRIKYQLLLRTIGPWANLFLPTSLVFYILLSSCSLKYTCVHSFLFPLMFNFLAPLRAFYLTSPKRYFLTPLAKLHPTVILSVALRSLPSKFSLCFMILCLFISLHFKCISYAPNCRLTECRDSILFASVQVWSIFSSVMCVVDSE